MIEASQKKPLVSIVIPVYNRGETIKATIDSVLSQTYQHIEVIVVDDGSTDETIEVLECLKNEKIHIIKQKHKGANAARNLGIELAKGDYLAFIDSADLWNAKKVERQLKFLLENQNEADIVFCAESLNMTMDIYHLPTEEQKRLIRQGRIEEIFVEGKNCIDTSTIFCKRNCFNVAGMFDEDLLRCQEYEWLLRALQKCRIKYLDECLVEANVREDSISANIDKLFCSIPYLYNKHHNFFTKSEKGTNILLIPLWEAYKRDFNYLGYKKYFDQLDKYIDSRWRKDIDLVYRETLKLLFNENVKKKYKIKNLKEGKDLESILKSNIEFNIFGAGKVSKKLCEYLKRTKMIGSLKYVIVTSKDDNRDIDKELLLIEMEECSEALKEMPLILAVNVRILSDVIEILNKAGFKNLVCFDQNRLM